PGTTVQTRRPDNGAAAAARPGSVDPPPVRQPTCPSPRPNSCPTGAHAGRRLRWCRGWEVPPSLVASWSVAAVGGSGALVISLDFELHWGMRDHTAVDPVVTRSLVASRSMVVTLAELFARREVRATWAT